MPRYYVPKGKNQKRPRLVQIRKLALKEKRAQSKPVQNKKTGTFIGAKVTGKKPKHERLGMDAHRVSQSQQIAKHPEIVEKVKAQAKENKVPRKVVPFAKKKSDADKSD